MRYINLRLLTYLLTGAISRAKLQSNHHHQQTNIQFFYRPDALPVAKPTVSKHWREKYHIPWTCLPKLTWGLQTFQLCLWPLIALVTLGRVAMPRYQRNDFTKHWHRHQNVHQWRHNYFHCFTVTMRVMVLRKKILYSQNIHMKRAAKKSRPILARGNVQMCIRYVRA